MKLQEKLENKLLGSKFRMINEKIYKNKDIKNIPSSIIKTYHKAYNYQIKKWKVNPLDTIIKDLKNVNGQKIADLGCGEAKLEKEITDCEVFSADLFPINDKIIKCNIEGTPLENESKDIVVLCLSLMKKNVSKIIKESYRILKNDGILYIAETLSRIDDLKEFENSINEHGFKVQNILLQNNWFIVYKLMKDQKNYKNTNRKILLKPCSYKKR